MSNAVPTRAEREASEWFARLNSEQCTAADRHQFDLWLAADPVHGRAYCQVERLWQQLGTLDPERLIAGEIQSKKSRARPTFSWKLSTVAVLLGVVILPIWWHLVPASQHYSTPVGGHETIVLNDGSRVEINTDTALDVKYTQAARELHLAHGEIYLEVAPASAWPFVVTAGTGQVEVHGTRFLVRQLPKEVTIALFEGIVDVTSGMVGTPLTRTRLPVGQSLRYDLQGRQTRPEHINLEHLQAWRRGELVFRETPLSEVVDTLTRYHPVHIAIEGKDVGQTRVSGVFRIGSVQSILKALADSVDAQLLWRSENDVVISALSSGQRVLH